MSFDCDFLIVGSGFGGAVSALRLAEKGYSVIVLEQGRHIGPEEIRAAKKSTLKLFWQPALGLKGFFTQRLFRHVGIIGGVSITAHILANGDNGNLNYDRYDVVAALTKLNSDLIVQKGEWLVRAHAVGHYDPHNAAAQPAVPVNEISFAQLASVSDVAPLLQAAVANGGNAVQDPQALLQLLVELPQLSDVTLSAPSTTM